MNGRLMLMLRMVSVKKRAKLMLSRETIEGLRITGK